MNSTLPKHEKVIALGDIHGDLKLAKTFFIKANLIDNNGNWIADPPNTIVVQVGDQIDSCRHKPCDIDKEPILQENSDDVGVILFFEEMNKIAKKFGGRVISLIGNHELMNTLSHFKYVSYNNLNNFNYKNYIGEKGRIDAFKPGGPIAKLLSKRPAAVIIGATLFVHAGILPEHLINLSGSSPEEKINSFNKKVKIYFEGKDESIIDELNHEESPFWTRLYGNKITSKNENKICGTLNDALDQLNVKKMVIGHTPQKTNGGLNSICNDNLFRIDGGFSTGFFCVNNNHDYINQFNYKKIEYLEIIDDKYFNLVSLLR